MINEFEYLKPKSFAQAVSFLTEYNNVRILAGGTDLIVGLRAGLESPDTIIDLKGISETEKLNVNSTGIQIGPAVTLNQFIDKRAIRKSYAALITAAESIATYQLRTRATVVGNICNASPAADMAPALLVFNASAKVIGPDGEKDMPLSDFFKGVKKTALKKGELVKAIEIPSPPAGTKSGFLKQQRLKGHDLAIASVAAAFCPHKNRKNSGVIRIALGAVAVTPTEIQEFPVNKNEVDKAVKTAIIFAKKIIAPIDDVRSSADYKIKIIKTLISRLIPEVLS